MKLKSILSVALLSVASISNAQNLTAPEPEFYGSYCLLTSDSTYLTLPKENGTIKKHESKGAKFAKIGGVLANVAGAGGMIGIGASGSLSGVIAGARTMSVAAGASQIAGAADALVGAYGQDIAFEGPHSSYIIPAGQGDVRLMIKAQDNNEDPQNLYRIVRFKQSKKERRIQWMEYNSALLETGKTDSGYIGYQAHKYGEQSYLITIPESEMIAGEYGIFFMSLMTSTAIPVGTFSIQ